MPTQVGWYEKQGWDKFGSSPIKVKNSDEDDDSTATTVDTAHLMIWKRR